MNFEQYAKLDDLYNELQNEGIGDDAFSVTGTTEETCDVIEGLLNGWAHIAPFNNLIVRAETGDKIAVYSHQDNGYLLVADVNGPWVIFIDEETASQFGL